MKRRAGAPRGWLLASVVGGPGSFDVYDEKGGAYIGLIRYVARGRWYWNTRRGRDGFAENKDAAKAVVVNAMREATSEAEPCREGRR